MDIESILNDAKEVSSKEPLDAHREAILVLRKKGYTWRDISKFLSERDVHIDHTRIYRFMSKLKINKEMNTMRKGIYIAENYYINLDKLCAWEKDGDHIQLNLNAPEGIDLINIKHTETINTPGDLGLGKNFTVSINEFKRIESEINEYMG